VLKIFGFLALGMLLGYIYQNQKMLYLSEKIAFIFVYLLLVLMGMSTAGNENFTNLFSELGITSCYLAIFGMLGSIFFTIPIYYYWFSKRKFKNFSFYKLKFKKQEKNNEIKSQNDIQVELISNPIEKNQTKSEKYSNWMSIIYPIISYIIGIFISIYCVKIETNSLDKYILYTLYCQLFCLGIGFCKLHFLDIIKNYHFIIIIIPFLSLFGSIAGGLLANNIFRLNMFQETISISSGMCYYSISAIINKSFLGDRIGTIALITNLLKEITTMVFCPLLVRMFGSLAPIATGGASTMDNTLPFIRRNTESQFMMIAFVNGVILSIVVPPLTTFIASYSL
jgi:uncharacterized membrane protein YbjE (DUF340 family)